MSVAANIRMYRKKAGLTQIDLASDIGVSIATLRRWEAGETGPSAHKIAELARALKVTPEDIVTPRSEASGKTAATVSNGMLIFQNGDTRVELPPTDKGYDIFNQLVSNMINKQKEREFSTNSPLKLDLVQA